MNSVEALRDIKSMEATEPPDESDDEDSFVVLEHSASINENNPRNSLPEEVLPLFRTNKVREMKSLISTEISQISTTQEPQEPSGSGFETATASITKIVITPDSSYEEIQRQVEELIKDNEKLKSTLAQTNINLKKQYAQFVVYKDEVNTVAKSYKDKISEAKIIIETLKKENEKLNDDVAGYINIKKLQEEEIINLKMKLKQQTNSSYVNIKTTETLNEVHKNDHTEELQTALASANLQLTDLQNQIDLLKGESHTLHQKIRDLETSASESTEKYEALKEQNVRLTQELSLKKQNIEKLTERLVESPNYEEQMQSKIEEITDKVEKINLLQFEKDHLKKENSDLQNELHNVKQESSKHQQIINKHLDEFKQSQTTIAALQQALQAAQSEISSTNKDSMLLRSRLKDLQEKYPNIEEECIQLRQQLSFAQETITQLKVEDGKRVQEIEKLRKLLQDSENDEIFALKEQVALYKHDFEAERESKTSTKRERDQIAEDLKSLQKRNQQLQNEIETMRARNQPKAEGYSCPKCNFGFNSYQSLENHVHRCLDLDGFP